MAFLLGSLPPVETTAQRLAVLLAQPGRRVKPVGTTELVIVCDDEAAVRELRAHVPHAVALRHLRRYNLRQLDPLEFFLEVFT